MNDHLKLLRALEAYFVELNMIINSRMTLLEGEKDMVDTFLDVLEDYYRDCNEDAFFADDEDEDFRLDNQSHFIFPIDLGEQDE